MLTLATFSASAFKAEFDNRKGSWTPETLREEIARIVGPIRYIGSNEREPDRFSLWHPGDHKAAAATIEEIRSKGCQGFMLLPATTGSEWFKANIAPIIEDVIFLRGRIREGEGRPIIDSMLVVIDAVKVKESAFGEAGFRRLSLQSLLMNYGSEAVEAFSDGRQVSVMDARFAQAIMDDAFVSVTLKPLKEIS